MTAQAPAVPRVRSGTGASRTVPATATGNAASLIGFTLSPERPRSTTASPGATGSSGRTRGMSRQPPSVALPFDEPQRVKFVQSADDFIGAGAGGDEAAARTTHRTVHVGEIANRKLLINRQPAS